MTVSQIIGHGLAMAAAAVGCVLLAPFTFTVVVIIAGVVSWRATYRISKDLVGTLD